MGRIPRIYFEGAIYHITVRGDNKEQIFVDKIDRLKYIKIVREYQKKYGFEIYAYVLMPNHIHFIIEPSDKANISVIMHHINNGYAKYFLWKYKRVGHVFQSRFFSNVIEKDSYLLSAVRYIHLNPVRAGLVKKPADWEWSSIQEYIGRKLSGLKVNIDFLLGTLAEPKGEQIRIFNQLHIEDITEKDTVLRKMLENSFFVGSDDYITNMNQRFGIGRKKAGRPKNSCLARISLAAKSE